MKKQTSIRLAADIGGTFTDIVLETPTDLYIVKGAPILSRPSYLVYAKSSINSDVVKMAVAGLRAANREMHLKC